MKEQFLSHTWSLAVEEQFYFIAPMLLLLILRRQLFKHLGKLIMLALALYIGLRCYFLQEAITLMHAQCAHTQSDLSGPILEASLQIFISPLHDCIAATEFGVLYDNLYTRFLGFVVGIAAALLHVRHTEVLRVWFHGSKLCIPMTLVATFAVLYPFVEQFLINDTQIRLISSRIIAHPMLNFGLGFWILALLHGSGRLNQWLARLLSSRALYVIAQLSYSMYLFHILIILGGLPGIGRSLARYKRCDGDVGRRNHLFSAYAHHLDWGLSFCRASRYRVEESVTRLVGPSLPGTTSQP